MPDYQRPPLPTQVFIDERGVAIDYGNRWQGEPPPEDAYEMVSNQERFLPLHELAGALIEHLRANFAVKVDEDISLAADLMHEQPDVIRAVRVTPVSPDAAALTFVFTSAPGLIVHAGLLHDFVFPTCHCNACDETVEGLADELEGLVLAVAAGGYSEHLDLREHLGVRYESVLANGSRRSGKRMQSGEEPLRLREAEKWFGRLGRAWQPWPRPSTASP